MVVIANESDIKDVNHPRVYAGNEAILSVIEESESELVVNALVGFLDFAQHLKPLNVIKMLLWQIKKALLPVEHL